jgi:hypothetical protein
MIIPQPCKALLRGFHADPIASVGNMLDSLVSRVLLVPFDPAAAHDEDIACSGHDVLLLHDGLDVLEGDPVRGHWVEGDVLFGGPGCVVDEDAATDYASAFAPVCVVNVNEADFQGNEDVSWLTLDA